MRQCINLNHSLKQPELDNVHYKIVEMKVPISSGLINDSMIQNSMNEDDMNFQYLDVLDVEFLNSNFKSKEAVLSIDENSTGKCSNEQKAEETETSSEGLTLKELPNHLKFAFLEPERAKQVIISAALAESEEQKLLETLRKYKEAIIWSIKDLKGISPAIWIHKILLEDNAKTSIEHC